MNGMGRTGEAGQTSTCCYCCSSVTCPMICTLTKALSLKTAQSNNNNNNNIMDSSYKEQISLQNKNSMHLDTPFTHIHINRHILYGHTNDLPGYIYEKACFKEESLDLGFELRVCRFCRLAESKIQTAGAMNAYREIKTKCDWVLNSECADFADWQKANSRQLER